MQATISPVAVRPATQHTHTMHPQHKRTTQTTQHNTKGWQTWRRGFVHVCCVCAPVLLCAVHRIDILNVSGGRCFVLTFSIRWRLHACTARSSRDRCVLDQAIYFVGGRVYLMSAINGCAAAAAAACGVRRQQMCGGQKRARQTL